MTDTGTPKPAGRKALGLLLVALIAALLIYVIYRTGATKTPPVVEPTTTPGAVAEEETPIAPSATPVPTASPLAACLPAGTPMPECKDYIVLVGPDANTLSHDPVCVGPSNRVVWRSWDGMSPLKIYFPASGFPAEVKGEAPPFAEMKRQRVGERDDWVFTYGGKESTNSGTPNPEFGVPGGRYCFKYDQELNGRRVDGHMIIQR